MSKIVLESTCEETANEILEGIFALIIPVITSTDGLCVAITRCIPAALAFCANLHIESSTSLEETIIKSANSSIIITICGNFSVEPSLSSSSLYPFISLTFLLANKLYLFSISCTAHANAPAAF